MPTPALLLDVALTIRVANAAYCRLMQTSESDVVGESFFDVHAGCWRTSALLAAFEATDLLNDNARLQLELNAVCGTRLSLQIEQQLLPEDYRPLQRIVTITDRTAWRDLESSLRKSEARNQTLLNSAVDAIVIINPRGTIKAFNPAAERLFGFSADEVLGLNANVLMPSPYRQEHDNYLRRYLETSERRVIGIGREVVGQRKDGTQFPMDLSISEIFDGEERLFVGTVRDITQAKRTKEALRDSEARGRAILSTAVDAIITIDESGLIKSLNPAAQRMFGYTYHEMIGENVRMLMPAPYKDEHDHYLTTYLHTGIPRVIGIGREAVGRRRDGSTFPMELSVSEVRQGDRRYFTGIVRDITERKRYEERLRESIKTSLQSESQLKAQAAELAMQTERLTAAQHAADVANQAKSDFLANMSHEIRTPLTAILGFAEHLLSTLNDEGDREIVEIIQRNGENLLEIINDILDISKIESGCLHIDPAPCNPCQIVSEVVSLLRVRAIGKGIALSIKYKTALPDSIPTDAMRLRQILLNLVSNAVKFTERGGVVIHLRLVDEPPEWPVLSIQVSDTGIGISDEQLALLFRPFSQADSSVTRRFGGTGLGLALSKRLVEMLGGTISVRSAVGVGSTFTLTLPIPALDRTTLVDFPGEAVVQRNTESRSRAIALPANLQVLLAEDGADNRRMLKYLLETAGMTVSVAQNGRIAVEMATRALQTGQPFDVILMDMQMPEMDGYEAARLLRGRSDRVPIIAITAHAMAGDRDKCLAAGCTEYVSKPVHRDLLFKTIQRALAQPATPLFTL